jgi:serine phosphatase RsbU (regulator of sigma subunit)
MQEQGRLAIDSLLGLLMQEEGDSLKALYYLQLSGNYQLVNQPEEAKKALEQALPHARRAGVTNYIANAYHQIGRIQLDQGDYPDAIRNFQDALSALGDTGYLPQRCFNRQFLGKAYEQQRLFDAAQREYLAGEQLALQLPDSLPNKRRLLSFAYNNLGNVLALQDSLLLGLDYQHRAIALRRQTGDSLNLAYTYNDAAVIYQRLDSQLVAKDYYERAWQIFLSMGRKVELAAVGGNLASIFGQLGLYPQALAYGHQAIEQAYSVNDRNSIMLISNILASVYSELGQYEQAFRYQEAYSDYRDSLFNEQRLHEVGRLESRLELQEKEAENVRKQAIIEEQRTTNMVIGSSLIILLFLAGLLLKSQQRQQRANRLLQLRNEEVNQQKEELTAQAESLRTANEEIRQQKEEIYAQAETLRRVNQEVQEKNGQLTLQHDIIAKKNSDMLASIQYASRIQHALLPLPDTLRRAFPDHFILYRPRDVVSGDFYWYGEAAGRQVLAVVDCTGHGVPGAFMSVLGHTILNEAVLQRECWQPEQVLEALDRHIRIILQQEQTANKDGMDAAICVVDRQAGLLRYAGAKMPLAYLDAAGNLGLVKGSSKAIAGQLASQQAQQFEPHALPLADLRACYLYTDGIQDQFGGERGKKLMGKRFREWLAQGAALPMQEQGPRLQNAFEAWMGQEKQIDDVLVVGIQLPHI